MLHVYILNTQSLSRSQSKYGRHRIIANVHYLQVYSALQNLARSFRHPQNAGLQMYYTVAWDYRRDMWEQAERVMKALRRVHRTTRCKTILVGHSFGSRLVYTLLAVCTFFACMHGQVL